MLGQKILDSFAHIDNHSTSSPLPPNGLSIRRIKSAGLRIVTDGRSLAPDTPMAPANSSLPSDDPRPYLSAITPDTSHTFGRPNPSMHSSHYSDSITTPHSSSSSSASLAARRSARYAQAENALRSAAESSSAESSPQELQIRALHKATAMLTEQARDAQSCAAKLRACLALKSEGENALSPDQVKTLQTERWLQERRRSARQSQSSFTRDLVTKLCSPVSEGPSPLPLDSPTVMTRHQLNMTTFIQLSPTRITFPHSRSPFINPTLGSQRQTISQIRPMRLRASALDVALWSPIKPRVRSKSLDGTHSRRNSDSTDATFVSEDFSEQFAVPAARPFVLQLDLKMPPSPLPLVPAVGTNGSVCIEKTECRPREQLLAEVGDVPLPGYAVDLLGDLDLVAASPDFALPALVPLSIFRSSSPMSSESEYDPTPRTSLSGQDQTEDSSAPFFLPPVRPPSPLHFASPMRSQSDNMPTAISVTTTTTTSTSVTAPGRAPIPALRNGHGHLRTSGAAQSLSLFSSRISHPAPLSLGTVPETTAAATTTATDPLRMSMIDFEPRSQTSMSDYMRVSAETKTERGGDDSEPESSLSVGFGFGKKRFSMATFGRRRRRFDSESGSVGSVDAPTTVTTMTGKTGKGPGIPFPTSPKSPSSLRTRSVSKLKGGPDVDMPGEDGILARFKKRVHRFSGH